MTRTTTTLSAVDDVEGRNQSVWARAVAYCVMSLIFGVQLSICGPTASLLAAQAGVTEADLAPVMAMGGVGMVLGGLPSGWVTDRFPGHHVLAISHLIQAVGFCLMPLCKTVVQLAVVYGAISLTFTMTNTALNCMAIWLLTPAPHQPTPPMTVAFLLNTISTMFGVGALAAPQICRLMEVFTGSGINIFYVATGMSLAVFLSFSVLPVSPRAAIPEPIPVATLPDHREAHATINSCLINAVKSRSGSFTARNGNVSRSTTMDSSRGLSRHATPAPGRDHEGADLAAAVRASFNPEDEEELEPLVPGRQNQKFRLPFLLAALVLIFANISIELGFGNWIFTYCIRQAEMTEHTGQQITSLFWLAFTLGRIPAMIMVAYVSVSTIMAITMPMAIIGALVPLLFQAEGGAPAPAPSPLLLSGGFHGTLALQPGAAAQGLGAAAGLGGLSSTIDFKTLSVVVSTMLVAAGSAAGTPCTLSLATEYITVDGFINGLIGTVAGIGATTFPYVVPVLAKAIPSLGFQCLMVATLFMALLQLASLVCMLSIGKAMGKIHVPAAPPLRERNGGAPDLEEPLLLDGADS